MATCESQEVMHDDLWVEILSWLPLRDLVKCRYVSKVWGRSLVPSAGSRRWRFGLLRLASVGAFSQIRSEYNGMSWLGEDDFQLGKFRDCEILDACNGYLLCQLSHELKSILGGDCYMVLNPITQNFSRPPFVKKIPHRRPCLKCFGISTGVLPGFQTRGTGGSVLVFRENIILFHVEGEQWESIQPPVVTLAPDERVGFGGLGQSVGAPHYARRDSRVKFFAFNQRLYILL